MSDEEKPSLGMQRQLEIYLRGAQGSKPAFPISIEDLEEKARQALSPEAYAYLAGGAGGEDTMRANREAFRRWRIVPRLLRDVAQRDSSVEILGQRLPAPLLLAPIGVQEILHPEAELAVARSSAELGIPFVLSTVSSRTIEQVAEAMGPAPRWFQLYWSRSNELTASLVKRAEQAGYGAIMVTLDTSLLAWRERDVQHAYLPFIHGQGLANYWSDPVFRAMLPEPPEQNPMAAIQRFAQIFSNPSQTWNDLQFLKDQTQLPILLKGILSADDAAHGVDSGADGIIVSNHGGRQVDGAVAALDALPGVLERVGSQTTVLFDSGIRRGSDLFKAVALGARAVLLGRPYAYGLAAGGSEGVRDVLLNFLADVELTLGLAGCRSFSEVQPDRLVRG